jgi:hypothetical protein
LNNPFDDKNPEYVITTSDGIGILKLSENININIPKYEKFTIIVIIILLKYINNLVLLDIMLNNKYIVYTIIINFVIILFTTYCYEKKYKTY